MLETNANSPRLAGALASTHVWLMARALFVAILFTMPGLGAAAAQTVSQPSLTLAGNHPPEAASFHSVGRPNPSSHLNLQITLGLRNRGQLDQLLRDQQNPASPQYHRWLTAADFAQRFGPSQQDAGAVAQWLKTQGFTVTGIDLAQGYVRFTGAVADAERAFATNIMAFGDGSAYSNVTDPLIPAGLKGVIGAVGGLDNFLHSKPVAQLAPLGAGSGSMPWTEGPLALLDPGPTPPVSRASAIGSVPDVSVNGQIAFGPTDVYSFYDEKPLLSKGVNGKGGDCLAVVGDSDFTPGAISLFNSQFGLPPSVITTVLVNGTNPGVGADELEALLDLEWSHAIAPGAPQRFYLGDNAAQTSNGPVVDGIQRAVNDNACGTVAVSFSLCGATKAFYQITLSKIYAQAAAQGQSILIASGDDGAAGVVLDATGTMCVPGTSPNINELGGDPNVTEVGGTMFTPNYDASGNNVGNVPESVWNAFYSNNQQLATGGGASANFSKPAYQKGPGVPADKARDVPDISLIGGLLGANGPGVFVGDNSTGTPTIDCCVIGTSLSVQTWAGISKLIAQLNGKRPGPLNPRIYALANAGLAATGFRDVTTGNNDFGNVVGFSAGAGFDLASGWGTVDIGKFANNYAAPPSPSVISVPSPILVGSSFDIDGSLFTANAVVNFFISTAGGPINAGPLTPSSFSSTKLTVPVPPTVPLGQGFVDVQVVDPDLNFNASNLASALLQGFAPAGIPSLTSIDGAGLAATSSNPSFAANNVQTVIAQGKPVTLGGNGFDATNGVAVNVFCACPPTGNAGPVFVTPGSGGLSPTSFTFTLPANVPTGPASLAVINRGAKGLYARSSNAVSVPVGAAISVKSVSQTGDTITVNGTGFSTLTVINFFNQQGNTVKNLGGISNGVSNIPLKLIDSTQFTFTRPAAAAGGPSYVEAFNPPYVPFASSGTGPGGDLNLQ